jgi:hypothetical protein
MRKNTGRAIAIGIVVLACVMSNTATAEALDSGSTIRQQSDA